MPPATSPEPGAPVPFGEHWHSYLHLFRKRKEMAASARPFPEARFATFGPFGADVAPRRVREEPSTALARRGGASQARTRFFSFIWSLMIPRPVLSGSPARWPSSLENIEQCQ